MQEDFAQFTRAHPAWQGTLAIDEMRRTQYPRIAASGEAYLDYTGASLHADSQVDAHAQLLRSTLMGNPHSVNRSSRNATAYMEAARAAVLNHFNAPPDEYVIIFTANATGALRLVGECYPFGPDRRFLVSQDNHNSVNGIGEFAKDEGAPITVVPLLTPDLRIDRAAASAAFTANRTAKPGLFAFPAQSNFSGVKHPLDLVAEAKRAGWDVLLDAAAFVPTNPLDLTAVRPDFVCLSFYKMFGYPTGIGCLLARREAMRAWKRDWFSGGNVKLASVVTNHFIPAEDSAALEDGTVDFLSLPAIEIGLKHLASVGQHHINERVRCLTAFTLQRMQAMRHRSGRDLVQLLGPRDTTDRGGTIPFTLHDVNGAPHDIRRVCTLAAEAGIGLRSGFFCNPGAGEASFGLTASLLKPIFEQCKDCSFDQLRAKVRSRTGDDIGAIRASFGIASDFSDAWRLVKFLEGFVDATNVQAGTAPERGA